MCNGFRWMAVASAVALNFTAHAATHSPRRTGTAQPKFAYDGNFDAQIGAHLHDPTDLATQRFGLAFEQRADFNSNWKAVAGFSAWGETVFATIPRRYSGSVIQDDSRDLRVRNLFLQYQSGGFFLRVGNQQVVWGEAFGFFYSDIVNPKDDRFGLFGDFSEIRLQTPIVNARYTVSDFSIQAIAIPKPYFDILPSPGNDFAYPYTSVFPVQSAQVLRQTTLPMAWGNQELGGRVSYLWDRLDLSAFYLSYFDRTPWYTIAPATQLPTSLVLQEQHSRVQSFGITATDDFGGYVARLEALTTRKRTIPRAIASPFGTSLGTAVLNDYIYVLGIDLPSSSKFNFGVQWSQDILSENPGGLFREPTISLITLRGGQSFFSNHSAELIYTYSVGDAGQRLDFNYVVPISGQLETRLGVEVLGGPTSSSFGQIYQATRAYAEMKCYLGGKN